MPKYGDLENKVVLLTGGANGIGAATVAALTQQGCVVEFCDVDASAGRRVERDCERSRFTRVDLTKERQMVRWIAQVTKRRSRIDGDPGAQLGEAVRAALYQNSRYGVPTIGWAHEMADAPEGHPRFAELASISELPGWIAGLSA